MAVGDSHSSVEWEKVVYPPISGDKSSNESTSVGAQWKGKISHDAPVHAERGKGVFYLGHERMEEWT